MANSASRLNVYEAKTCFIVKYEINNENRNNMKRVLILAYYFNHNTVGAIRIRGLVKYLHDFGWEPVIITLKTSDNMFNYSNIIEIPSDKPAEPTENNNFNIHRVMFKNNIFFSFLRNRTDILKFFIHFRNEFFYYPDPEKKWSNEILLASDKILNERSFDAIISTSVPFSSHIIAHRLKERYGLPWIADLRDLWTQSHNYLYSDIRKFFEESLEINTLSTADAITTVSQPLVDRLVTLHKREDIYSINNGFVPDEVNPGEPLFPKFTITYTGYIFPKYQDPEPLFKALHKLSAIGLIDLNQVDVNFLGVEHSDLLKYIETYGLQDVVRGWGYLPRTDVLFYQRRSHLLLLLTWNNPQEKGILTGKLFEYLAAQRPILALGKYKMDGVADLLKKTNAGVHLMKESEIEKEISAAYTEYKRTHGTVKYCGISKEIDKYSQVYMVKKFANLLDQITAEKTV
jgi:hypothetical protein